MFPQTEKGISASPERDDPGSQIERDDPGSQISLDLAAFPASHYVFLFSKTTVSTCPETVEKIIILVHAVWELVKVGTCCSGICQKYDAPLPLMISATLQNTLNWNLAIYSQSFFIIQYASI